MSQQDPDNSTAPSAQEGSTPKPESDPPPSSEALKSEPAAEPTVPEAPVGAFVRGLDERCMWVDPFANDARIGSGGVLLGDIIDQYVKSYNLLFENNAAYSEGKLKGGSYTMTPDEQGAYTFVINAEGKAEKKELTKDRDQMGYYYLVPPNSLVYIRLKQKLRLPFYIIGRHNLKIRYVYKGLLLGTGPQVDPGFEGNLFIPLHNFTTSTVRIYITGKESSFVSIDFVRTTPLFTGTSLPMSLKTVTSLRAHLATTDSRVLIEEKKVKERLSLEDYLEGDRPRSQLAQFHSSNEQFKDQILTQMDSVKKWVGIERIAIFLTVGSLLVAVVSAMMTTGNLFRGSAADLKSESKTITANQTALETRLGNLETNTAQSANNVLTELTTLGISVSNAATSTADLQNRLKLMEARLAELQSRTATGSPPPSSVTNRP